MVHHALYTLCLLHRTALHCYIMSVAWDLNCLCHRHYADNVGILAHCSFHAAVYCVCHNMMFHTQWAPSMRRNELLLEMTWEVTTTVLSMTPGHMASDVTAEWRRELFDVVLTDSLDRQSCVMSAPWYLLWCRLRHCVDEDDDELRCPWRRDDVVGCWLNINWQLDSSVLCDECSLVLARVQAATLWWWARWRAACPEQAPMDKRRLTEDLMFCASYIVERTCNCPAFRFSTSLRRWPMRSLWKDAVLWQHADWSIYMVGKLNGNGSCRVGYVCSAWTRVSWRWWLSV